MHIGQKIKSIRQFRGMTQKELGAMLGFSSKYADVRIAQYESGTRTPKKELQKKISNALKVNPKALVDHSINSTDDIIFTLFDYENIHELSILISDGVPLIKFNEEISEKLLQWKDMKDKLDNNIVNENEYLEWKYSFTGE